MQTIVILISGRGSNLDAILKAASKRGWNARIAAVISNRKDAPGLEIAKKHQIPVEVLQHQEYPDRERFDQALIEKIDAHKPDLVVLAGFMRLLTDQFVDHYEGRLINIHPSLLPSFPGLQTHAKALEKGVKWHGATVHFVGKIMDEGPIIAQGAVPVLPTDTPDLLAQRVLKIEHQIFTQAIEWFLNGRLRQENGIVTVFPPDRQFFNFDENSLLSAN